MMTLYMMSKLRPCKVKIFDLIEYDTTPHPAPTHAVHTGEIIGGHEAVAHSRPYMVLLELHKPGGQKAHCDGFLVNEHFVVTAAHCQAE